MKLIRTQDAVGQMLCHDITRIVRGVVKDTPFRKGHIVTAEDIPLLLSLGKDNLYIWENDETMMHENEAAEVLRSLCQGADMHAGEVREGKIELTAEADGLFLVDVERLRAVNSLGQICIATRSSGFTVHKGDRLCGMRVIPLIIKRDFMDKVSAFHKGDSLLKINRFVKTRFAVVTTGNEVFHGRIKDTFTPVLEEKLAEFGAVMVAHEYSDDDAEHIKAAIAKVCESDAEMIFCTGGMSVDPDDRTPLAIRESGAEIISYGSPVLPGSMFLMGYLPDGRPIAGLPGCVMYNGRTIFDLVLPYILSDTRVTAEQLSAYGNGGLCLGCKECHFPNCGFGHGV